MEKESPLYQESPSYRERLGYDSGYYHPGLSTADPLSDYGRGVRRGQEDREDDDVRMGMPGATLRNPLSIYNDLQNSR